MKPLKPITRAERVDSWSTAFLILLLVHTGISVLSLKLEGGPSLGCGILAAGAYLFARGWARQFRSQGRGALAWTAVRVFETACVSLVVFLLATMYAGILGSAAMFYLFGGVLTGSFVTYRVLTWQRQYGEATDEPPPQDHWR